MDRRSRSFLLFTAAATIVALMGVTSCERPADAPAGEEGWLVGSAQEKFNTLADQHAGFSRTMVEVGYRFTELHWAGEDENWDFASYQIEHIQEALEAGFERRPVREASAADFLQHGLPAVLQAVEQRDRDAFREQLQNLAMHCNACHAMEDVGFIHVRVPTKRFRPWGAEQWGGGQ